MIQKLIKGTESLSPKRNECYQFFKGVFDLVPLGVIFRIKNGFPKQFSVYLKCCTKNERLVWHENGRDIQIALYSYKLMQHSCICRNNYCLKIIEIISEYFWHLYLSLNPNACGLVSCKRIRYRQRN